MKRDPIAEVPPRPDPPEVKCENCAYFRIVDGNRLCTEFDLDDPTKLLGLPAQAVFDDVEGCNGGEWFTPKIIVAH